MSFYAAIAGVACIAVGQILVGVACVISSVKGNQTKDLTERRSLKVASYFLAFSILFGILTLISGFILLGTKGCSKANKIFFGIVFSIFAICYIIGLVIIYTYYMRKKRAGDTASARDLQSAFVLPIVAAGLYLLGFILLFATIGSKLRKVGKVCKKIKAQSSRIKAQTSKFGGASNS